MNHRVLVDELVFNKTRKMLRQGQHEFAEIAESLGFTDSSNFSRSFTRVAGVSPSEFRSIAL